MIRAFRTVVEIAGLVGGIGFVRAGMYPLAAMGIGLGLVLLFLSGREMLKLWRSRPQPG